MSNKTKGVTLVETLFSSAIIALVIVSVLVIFAQTLDISKRVDCEYAAMNLAKNRLERARAIIGTSGFDSLPDLSETDTEIDIDSDDVPDFKRSTTVTTSYGTPGDPNLTEVEVAVTYKYMNEWKGNAAITVTTVFVDM